MEQTGGNGRPRVSNQNVEYVRLLSENNPCLSMRQAEPLMDISRSVERNTRRRHSQRVTTLCV